MKIDARNVNTTLKKPGNFRVILLYGENNGLVRERAVTAVKAFTGTLEDPFQVCILDKENHNRLIEEAFALSLMGGHRAVWVREADDGLSKNLQIILDTASKMETQNSGQDTLIVLESSILSTKSSLRILAEKHPLVATIACYAEKGRSLEETIRNLIGKKSITPEALHRLTFFLGTDRNVIRNEIEKLLLYCGDKQSIDVNDVQQSMGDDGDFSLEDAIFAALSGNRIAADRALERAFMEGVTVIAVIRALLYHLHRLCQVRLAIEAGTPAKTAISQIRPPIFFKQMDAFTKSVQLWNSQRLFKAAEQVQHLEYLSKQTQMPAQLLCQRLISSLSAHSK